MKKIRIYDVKLQALNLKSIKIHWTSSTGIQGAFSIDNPNIISDNNTFEYHFEITNRRYIDLYEQKQLKSVSVVTDNIDATINIIDDLSGLSVYNCNMHTTNNIQLKYIASVELDILGDENTASILGNVHSITYFDSSGNEIVETSATFNNINSKPELVIDDAFDAIPDRFRFNFNTDSDALIRLNVYQLGTLVSSESEFHHISVMHTLTSGIKYNKVMFLNFIDIVNAQNLNNELHRSDIDNITVTYTDSTATVVYNVGMSSNDNVKCIYFDIKNKNVKSVNIRLLENPFENEMMVNVSIADIYKTKYKKLSTLFNIESLGLDTLLTHVDSEVKLKIIQHRCMNTATFLVVELDNNIDMTIHDIDVNHIYKNYEFKYYMSVNKHNEIIAMVYISPYVFELDDINFIGIKYQFSDITETHTVTFKLFNEHINKTVYNIELLGRTTDAVIALTDNPSTKTLTNTYYNDSGLYNKIADLPSEYVVYGDYDFDYGDEFQLYADIDLSLSPTADNDFTVIYDKKAILQSLHNLFQTIKNDRPLKPWLEANLRNRLFDIDGNILNHIIETYIQKYISQVEPRVEIKEFTVQNQNTNFNTIEILIIFCIIKLNKDIPFLFNIQVD